MDDEIIRLFEALFGGSETPHDPGVPKGVDAQTWRTMYPIEAYAKETGETCDGIIDPNCHGCGSPIVKTVVMDSALN